MNRRFSHLTLLLLALLTGTPDAATAQQSAASPLHYGHDDTLSPPKALVFSIGTDKIIADAAAWKAMGVDGFFMEGVASEWSTNIWSTDGKPHTIGESDETFQKVREAVRVARDLDMEVFLKLVYANPLEWFNETAWQQIEHNFKQFAIFARDTGCKGIAVDIEYVGQQYSFDWEGYDYDGYTRKDLIRTIRDRSTRILRAMYREFPEMAFLILPEESFTLGTHIETAWVEEAARQNAPGGVHLFMESTYTSGDLRRTLASAAADNLLFHRLLSPAGAAYWEEKCSLAAGAWPAGFDVVEKSPPEAIPALIRECWAGCLMLSSRYTWIYLDRYAEQHLGRERDKFPGSMDFAVCAEILRKKEIITDEPYAGLARSLRTLPANLDIADLKMEPIPRFMFPYAVPMLELTDTGEIAREETTRQWDIALNYYNGVALDLPALFSPIPEWQIIGPFASAEPFKGHGIVFPPESNIDLAAEYDGVNGKIRWQRFALPQGSLSVDLKPMFSPNELTTAYAACWVDSPVEQQVQARFGSNDAGKLWIGGVLVKDFDHESWSVVDRDIIPVTLPKGRTPVLAKITNGIGAWSLVLRFTDALGNPVPNLSYSAMP